MADLVREDIDRLNGLLYVAMRDGYVVREGTEYFLTQRGRDRAKVLAGLEGIDLATASATTIVSLAVYGYVHVES